LCHTQRVNVAESWILYFLASIVEDCRRIVTYRLPNSTTSAN
jgi:hypothetical protein